VQIEEALQLMTHATERSVVERAAELLASRAEVSAREMPAAAGGGGGAE
jgi:hypothetical protein